MVASYATVIFFIGVIYFNSDPVTPCVTPDGDKGECMPITDCPSLRTATIHLNGQNEIEETNRFLNASTCTFDTQTNERIVCCAVNKELEMPVENTSSRKSNIDVLPDTDRCGISHSDDGYSRIIGGFEVTEGQFPWLVALGYDFGGGVVSYSCGASLIGPSHVLTAGHCVKDLSIIRATIGSLNLFAGNPYLIGEIVQTYLHEDYDGVENHNDIAVIKVQWINSKGEKVEFKPSKTADIICLPKTDELRKNSFERYYPFISGWGTQQYNNTASRSSKLLGLQVPVVKNKLCEQKYKKFKSAKITNNVLCAGYMTEKHDSCQGDSGGPLMLPVLTNGETRYYQIGVVSKGYKCAIPGMPGIYTRVGNYIEWIASKMVL